MTDPENFLARWSRRKLVAEEPLPAAADAAPQKPAKEEEGVGNTADKTAAPSEPVFDPASLPSLDSIGAETDISAFLKPNVPGDLRLAALRRAWVSDPAIRDFKGLAENDWDFTVTNEAMGFGEIDPGLDMKKMLADVFGDTPRAERPVAELPAAEEQTSADKQELSSPAERVALNAPDGATRKSEIAEHDRVENAGEAEMVHRNKNAALQSSVDTAEDAQVKRRRPHGGALPQ